MASREVYRQTGEEPGKWWRYLGLGVAATVIVLAVIDAINFEIPRIGNG